MSSASVSFFTFLIIVNGALVAGLQKEDLDLEHWFDEDKFPNYLSEKEDLPSRVKFGPRKSFRDNENADVEVILNPGPMIAPDIIIRQYVDPKMTVDKMMEDMLAFEKRKHFSEDYESKDIEDEEMAFADEANVLADNDSHESVQDFVEQRNITDPEPSELKTFVGNMPCRTKLNGTTGSFSFNFTENCLILVTTPEQKSTVVLNCSPVVLGNCSTNRDSLTVNLKGDMRFRRNSYVYCGARAQIRATSLRRRISIKIRKTEDHQSTNVDCTFHTRKRRELSTASPNSILGIEQVSQNCGRLGRNARIVGGRRVSQGLFPWVAQLDITRTDGSQTACTGTLVSPHYVLSAAHCLKNAESISVFLGGTDRHEFTGSEMIVQAEKYILHRKWSARTLSADIALVKLTDAVKYTEDVSPICLPTGKLRNENMEGRKGVAVGWGRVESRTKAPRQLYRVRLPFLDDASCQKHYRRFFVPKTMVCTDSTTDAAICYGDSGGPLMYKRQDKVYQIGVASFSLSKVCGASPDVFTHVGEYSPWIEGRVQKALEEDA